jgi:hypothetical protein
MCNGRPLTLVNGRRLALLDGREPSVEALRQIQRADFPSPQALHAERHVGQDFSRAPPHS